MNHHLTMFNIFPLQIFMGPKAPNSFISSRYYTGGYLFNVSHHWLSHTSANICSAPNLCRRPLGVLHVERVHGYRPRVHLKALFCPRQREALRHEPTPAAPMCGWVSYTSRGKAIYIFSSGAGAAEPLRLGQRTQVYGSQESRVVIFAISVSSHPIEQHAAAVRWKNILLPRTLPSFFFTH